MAAYTTIDNPELYFQTQLYTGNGSSGHAITFDGSENMQPDLVWIKQRDSRDHFLYNAVNGATKYVASNTNALLETDTDTMTAFNSDGFTLGSGIGVNENTDTHVSWNWKMGTTSGITTGGASVTPAGYSFSATAGQSVITWTGTGSNLTVPHGLGTALGAMFVKCTSHAGDWVFFHKSLGGAYGMEMPSTSGKQNTTAWFNSTAPDADKFTIGTNGNVNTSGRSYVAYCFAEKQGYSKFGSYVGNGSADPLSVNCGFKPAFIFIKESSGSGNWVMQDNKRIRDDLADSNNGNMIQLYANSAGGDDSDPYIYATANGFVNINANSDTNASGETYIFMAFAEASFVNSKGVPNNAR